MMQLIFRNRYAALAWVGLSLFSAALFVGDGGASEKLEDTAEQVRAQNAAMQPSPEPEAEAEPEEEGEPGKTVLRPASDEGDGMMVGPDGRKYKIVTREELAEAQEIEASE